MRSFLLILSLYLFSSLGWVSSSYGAPDCSICLTEMEQENKIIQCPQGHVIHPECLHHQIESMGDIREIRTVGLPCHGAGGRCDQRFLLNEIRRHLEAEQRKALDKRLSQAFDVTDKCLAEFEFRRLSQGIQEAFNLRCPAEGCGSILAAIEGCNAATCQDSACKATFCFLCLKEQESIEATFRHVGNQHSGDYWDFRPGYPERYHWLLAREELGTLFKKRVDSWVRESVLRENKELLDDRKMWPFPCGKMTAQWLQEVRSDPNLTLEEKIELLQNEAIYQRQMKNRKSTLLVRSEIRKLGGVALVSLDVKDGAGVFPQRVQNGNPEVAAVGNNNNQRIEPWVLAVIAQNERGEGNQVGGDIIPVMADDPRVTPEFAALGDMVQVGNLIWSGVSPRSMNHRDAKQFCEQLDSRNRGWFRHARGDAKLPSIEDFESLRAAMIHLGNYDPNLVPGMRNGWNKWFWSSSSFGFISNAQRFYGNSGRIHYHHRRYEGAVRCVRAAEPREL